MATAVLDVGKTNAKLAIVDEAADLLASWTTPVHVRPGPPYPHLDTDAIWRWFLDHLGGAARAHSIEAIVPVGHGATGALLGDDGLVLPVLDYEHPLPEDIEAEFAALRDPFEVTLSPDLPAGQNFGRQLFWQQQAFPEAFARTRRIVTYPQYWACRLSGEAAIDVSSLGAHSHLWRPREGRWSGLVERCGWTAKMAPVRPAFDSLGPIRPELAEATGVAEDCRILVGIHDSNASYLEHRVSREPPFTVVSTGTWVIVMAAGGDLDRLEERRDGLANIDVLGQPVACMRFMGGREYARIIADTDGGGADEGNTEEGGTPDPADVAALIEEGVMVHPAFAEGGPFPGRKGRIDPAPPTDPRRLKALAILYCALETDLGLDLVGARPPFVIEGSFARTPLYAALLAALRPEADILVSDDATGTTRGALRLARWHSPDTLPPPATRAATPAAIPALPTYSDRWRRVVEEG